MTTRPQRAYFQPTVATTRRQIDGGFTEALYDAYKDKWPKLYQWLECHDEGPIGYERTQALIGLMKHHSERRKRRGRPKEDAIPTLMIPTLKATAADLVREARKQMPPRGQVEWGGTLLALENVVRQFKEQGYAVDDDEREKARNALHRGKRTTRRA
jgi:hypothetical protein